jgi:hypothetical protein
MTFLDLLKIYLAEWYQEPYDFQSENVPGQDFVTVCARASGHFDCMTNSKNGVRINDSLGLLGDFMTEVADAAAKEVRLKRICVFLRRAMR